MVPLKDCIFMGFETLPWACRFTEWGRKATVLGTKACNICIYIYIYIYIITYVVCI